MPSEVSTVQSDSVAMSFSAAWLLSVMRATSSDASAVGAAAWYWPASSDCISARATPVRACSNSTRLLSQQLMYRLISGPTCNWSYAVLAKVKIQHAISHILPGGIRKVPSGGSLRRPRSRVGGWELKLLVPAVRKFGNYCLCTACTFKARNATCTAVATYFAVLVGCLYRACQEQRKDCQA